jgi:oligopeptide/dipeptide ABC transporter ATP-binding protein
MVNDKLRGEVLDRRVRALMERVGLQPEQLHRYPYAFSGGQRQRIGVARALALDPEVLLADEPTSALDVSVQAQILNLLLELQRDLHLTVIFVTHDLSVIRHMSDRVAVMYLGHFVEVGDRAQIFGKPLHPYTEALFSGIPQPNPHRPLKRIILEGDIPDVAQVPSGCPFHTRCPYKQARCEEEIPPLAEVGSTGRQAACHFADELDLKGEHELLGQE